MKIGAKVQDDFSKAGLPGMQVVKLPSNLSVNDAIAEYRKNPDILYVQPNYIYHTAALTPNDPSYNLQWGLNNTENLHADINAPDAWGVSTGSNAVIVAVIDTGVDYNHPDLSSNIWINPGESGLDNQGFDKRFNGIDDDNNEYIDDWHGWNFYQGNNDPMDGNTGSYHGTHCAGILGAAGNNGVGVCGVNWNVTIMPLRTTDVSGLSNSSSNIMAINYASSNAAGIISNSWGGYSYDQALKDAIDNSPALVVCAAGNDNVNTDLNPFYPASFNSTNLISVAATDSSDNKASFSNYGQISVDLAAPGVNIYSTKKDSTYQFKSGTSMATPFVAGVAALVKSTNPLLTNNQIKNIIFNNIDVKPSLSGKVNTSGRLNAYKAVLAAQRMAQPEMIGVVRHNNTWLLDASGNGAWGAGDLQYNSFWQPGDVYVTGDWTGNGITKMGAIRFNNTWLLDASGNGVWDAGDLQYTFGQAGDVYVTGDWTGNGTTKIGVVRFNNTWLLEASGNGAWSYGDLVYAFGKAGDAYVTGEWN